MLEVEDICEPDCMGVLESSAVWGKKGSLKGCGGVWECFLQLHFPACYSLTPQDAIAVKRK